MEAPVEGLDESAQSTAGAAATLQAEASRPKPREVVVLRLQRFTEDQHKDTNTSGDRLQIRKSGFKSKFVA